MEDTHEGGSELSDYKYASVTQLTQWMTDRLNENPWSIGFDAIRYNLSISMLEKLEETKICVYPLTIDTSAGTRCTTNDIDTIAVQIYASVLPSEREKQDQYIRLMEEIRDYFFTNTETMPEGCTWQGARIEAVIDLDALSSINLFSSRLGILYKCRRETPRAT